MSNEKTKQLPPELVEKITPLLENYSRGNKTGYVQGKCVQLIIDYAQPFKDELSKWIGLHEEKDQYAKLIEKQRDELLEALRESQRTIEVIQKDHNTSMGWCTLHVIEQLIQKHES